MPTIRTKYLGNLRTEIEHVQSGEKTTTDAPVDNHGKGEYISPSDLFVASYASCIFTTMGIAAANHGFSIDGITAETTKIMAENPRRVARIELKIILPHANYSERERRLIEATANQCPVALNLHPDIKKDITFIYQH